MADLIIYAISFGFVGVLMYGLLRFGPVNNSWMGFEKEHLNRLKEANKNYKDTQTKTKPKPSGQVLYKAKLVSHNGLIIYSDGIYAKWSLGPNGKYKFKPWEMITDIFPAEVSNPFAQGNSKLMGAKGWKSLQFEAEDFEVITISSTNHKFDRLIPIIKNAMIQWEGVYREHETIHSTLTDKKLGWHTLLRGRQTPIVTKEGEAASEKVEGRGSLILEEPQFSVDRRKSQFFKLGMAFLLSGPLILGFLAYDFFVLKTDMFCFATSLMIAMLGVILIVFGVILYRGSKWNMPMKIYENGLLNYVAGNGKEAFVPFGQFTDIIEKKNMIYGEHYSFVCKDIRYSVPLQKDIPGVVDAVNIARDRIGKPEYDLPIDAPSVEPMLNRMEHWFYGAMVAFSVVLSIFFVYSVVPNAPQEFIIWALVFFSTIFIIVSTLGLAFVVNKNYIQNNCKKGANMKVVTSIVLISMAFFFVNYYTPVVEWDMLETEPYIIDVLQDEMPASAVLLSSFTNDTTVYLDDNLSLATGESLHLNNVSIVFNCSSPKEYSIWTAPGSNLIMENCSVSPNTTANGYGFEIHGNGSFLGCTFSEIWGDEENNNGDGGMEIYSSNVVIDDCSFLDCQTNGIMVVNCSPVITNNYIARCGDDAIEAHGCNSSITNNRVEDNPFGVLVWSGSRAIITENVFLNNGYGLGVFRSSPRIESNTFASHTELAVEYDEDSDPVLKNNEYQDNELNVEKPGPSMQSILEICGAGVALSGVLGLAILIYQNRMNFGKKEE